MNVQPPVERAYAYYLGQLDDFLLQSHNAHDFAEYLASRHEKLNEDQPLQQDQVNTWVAEVLALRKLLKEQRGDLIIALEATVGHTNGRADILLCGTNSEDAFCYDVIEAKGWHTARRNTLPSIPSVYDRRRYDIDVDHREDMEKGVRLNLRRYTDGDNRRVFSVTSRDVPDPRNQVWGYRTLLDATLSSACPDGSPVIDASVLMYNQRSVRLDLRETLENDIKADVLKAVPIYTRNRSGGSRSFTQLQRHLAARYDGDNGDNGKAYNHLFLALQKGSE